MKTLKQLLTTLFLLCCVLGTSAQAEVTVEENNGTSSTIVVSDLGKIYFSSERMYIDAGDGAVSEFVVSDIRKMTFNRVTGIENHKNEAHLLLYPNPASNFFKIAAEKAQTLHVQLYSLTGQLLTDTYCQTDETVNISELQSGIYFVKVDGVTFKLLKK